MANDEHVALLKKGVAAWNAWRAEHPEIRPDLRFLFMTDLGGGIYEYDAGLNGAKLCKANLSGADLAGANLYEADLTGADLGVADLTGARLIRATLCEADLNGARLGLADLRGANLTRANLYGADLGFLKLNDTTLTDADLSQTKLVQADLSAMDLRTVKFSGASLYGANLRGADLRGANLSGASLSSADLSGAKLGGADLRTVRLLNTNLTNADLTGCLVLGVSVWDVTLDNAKQENLVITHVGEPVVTVDSLEVAQFVYLLLRNPKIRDLIDTIGKKAVLILGRFTPERKAVLDALREELRKRDYVPILFDFPKPDSQDLTATVSTLAHLACFIIADLTDPSSVAHELAMVVPTTPVPVKPILLSGSSAFTMFADLRQRYHWVLPIYRYRTLAHLIATLPEKVIAPAEKKVQALRKRTRD